MREHTQILIRYLIAALCVLGILIITGSCKTIQTSQNHTSTRVDTVRIIDKQVSVDTVMVDRWRYEVVKGDTILIRDSIRVLKYVYRTVADTSLYSHLQTEKDSIYVTNTVEKVVRSGYDKFTSWGFWILLVLLLLGLAWWLYRKFR